MPNALIVLPKAEQDIADAYAWYESRTRGLGEYFLRKLDDCFASLEQRPLMFEVVLDDFRRALVHRFPYAVFFEYTQDRVIVHSVFHCSQDPEKIRKQLRRP